MEITKGENANLAGMEPRLTLTPEVIGNGWYSLQIDGKHIWRFDRRELDLGLERRVAEINAELRSPAPTPPLDVEARELEEAWSMLVERGVRIYTLSTALIDRDAYARTERAITQLLSLLRRHIASPAPDSNKEPE